MNISEKEFCQIINTNSGRLHHLCRVYAEHKEDEKDIFQEIVIQVWESLSSFNEEAQLSTWIYRIGLNTAISFTRKKKTRKKYYRAYKKEQKSLEVNSAINPIEESSEKLDLIYDAIDQLNLSEKTIITMYLEDFSYKEIGYVTDLTENHVGVKLSRIKDKLSNLLGD